MPLLTLTCFSLDFSNNDYCAARFENAECNPLCNNEACLKDGLDCETSEPKLVGGDLLFATKHNLSASIIIALAVIS